jgi:hypothetical protein
LILRGGSLSLFASSLLCIYVLYILPQLEIVKINDDDDYNKEKGSEILRETGDAGQTLSQ